MARNKGLKEEIETKYGTVCRFIKAHNLCKSTVYQVVKGAYAGDGEKQAERFRELLAGNGAKRDETKAIFRALKRTACARCPDRDDPGPRCRGCIDLF